MQCECNDHASECDISGDCWVSLTLGEGDQQSGDPSVTPSVRPSNRVVRITPAALTVSGVSPVSMATPQRGQQTTASCVLVL